MPTKSSALETAEDVGRTVDALRLSEAHLRGILDAAFDAIVVIDDTQRIVQVNPAATAMFGYAAEALLGAPLGMLLPAPFRARHRLDVEGYTRGNGCARPMSRARDVWALHADGHLFPVHAAISGARVADRQLFTAVLRDVTEARRAEEALRSGKAQLEAALANMSDAVVIYDARGQVVHLNAAFAAFHRFASPDECRRALDRPISHFRMWHPDGTPVPTSEWPMHRALRGETATGVEYRLERPDNGDVWVGSYSYAPIPGADHRIAGSVVVARDITGLKRTHDDLERSRADLRRLLAERDRVQEDERRRIARDLHDDLQQTLSAINISLATARQRLGKRLDASAALESARRLTLEAVASTRRIVENLRPKLLDELGLVHALQDLATRSSVPGGLACSFTARGCPDESGWWAPEVATCVYRIAQEALNNVMKHAGASWVRIELEVVAGSDTVLTVSDDGRGIRPQDRGKVQSFGLLGMAERAHAVGGTLEIQGDGEQGTTLVLRIPVAPRSAEPRRCRE